MDIKWYEHITEEEVKRGSGQRNVIEKLRTNRWRYFGCVFKMGEEKLPKQVLSRAPEGSRCRDRPNDTWRRTIQRDMSTRVLVAGDVERVVWGGEDWRRLVADPWAI